ncbi:helix-turn-helix domain-containing protein [Flavobacterium piscis]|uniref:AraC-like DNA-binding protein n=1 Tax=Flavobacterium piscis TaxID=1114874 RepID=A0ABU1YA47_9FLAO|nr:helix-turn-helix domain-containing protein [Flavobacterium piscis]MDR7211018.1 AraC-like DNA-binding protein [Flavobacterium piscis]
MHYKFIPFLFIIVFSHFQCHAQASKYDSIFSETSQVLLSSNPKKALANTDYLYKISKNNSERIKAYMLKATLLRQYGIRKEAASALVHADSLAILDKDYTFQARINGFLSTLYRENEIPSIGKIYLQKAVAVSRKIEDKNEMYKFQGNLSQEIAYYEMIDANYSKAIASLKKGNQLFEKAGPNIDRYFQLAVNGELIAKNYLLLHKIDSALYFYEKSNKELDQSKSSNSPLKGFIYNGFGNVYTSSGDYKSAALNYQKAEQIADASNFFALKDEVYSSLLDYYKKTENSKKYISYNELYQKLHKSEEYNRKIIANDLIKTLRKKQIDTQSKYQKSTFIIIGSCIFIVILTLGLYIYRRKQDYKKFKKFINKKETETFSEIEATLKKDTAKDYMSVETEKSILESIQKFEKSKMYLNKDISLNSMAGELGINHRYLSYVIKKHNKKDFASYISELRINFIVDRLRNDSDYLKYKISYLADQSGFLSHSRFTTTFKKITGASPLAFITYLQKEREEKK